MAFSKLIFDFIAIFLKSLLRPSHLLELEREKLLMFKSSQTANQPDLGSARLGPLLVKLALPCIVAQVINVLYNIVDQMYIGHIPGTGTLALTGVGGNDAPH